MLLCPCQPEEDQSDPGRHTAPKGYKAEMSTLACNLCSFHSEAVAPESGYRQHCMYTLLQELKRTGFDNPALSMLVEPLLPRAWRKELDKQKLLKGDEDTDL